MYSKVHQLLLLVFPLLIAGCSTQVEVSTETRNPSETTESVDKFETKVGVAFLAGQEDHEPAPVHAAPVPVSPPEADGKAVEITGNANFAIVAIHNPKRPVSEDEKDDPMKPLTAEQIAEYLEWFTPAGRPSQSEVSRRMEAIYGSSPMDKYRMTLVSGDARERLSDRLRDGTHAGERFVESDIDELDLD